MRCSIAVMMINSHDLVGHAKCIRGGAAATVTALAGWSRGL